MTFEMRCQNAFQKRLYLFTMSLVMYQKICFTAIPISIMVKIIENLHQKAGAMLVAANRRSTALNSKVNYMINWL